MPVEQATLNHTARILVEVTPQMPADAALRKYFYQHTYLGPRERRAISRSVFIYYRWWRWLDLGASRQKQAEHAITLDERFQRDPKSVKPEALAARAVPDWLHEEMELPTAYLQQIQREPSLWLRARPGSASKLASSLGHCKFTPHAPDALHYQGTQDLFRTPQFHHGDFEIQDLSSQLVGFAALPSARQTWWDACAGEGGKTLHLADQMNNKGVIWATDRAERRLQTLKRRATRAKLFNYRTALWDGGDKLPTKAKFDGILVDAPCSGVGTWQRNPHARWTTTRDDVRELARTQLALLNRVAGSLKPGGRLIYSVCTLTRTETAGVVEAFTAAHPELAPAPVLPGIETGSGATPSTASYLWPHELNANGMFIAAWSRRA